MEIKNLNKQNKISSAFYYAEEDETVERLETSATVCIGDYNEKMTFLGHFDEEQFKSIALKKMTRKVIENCGFHDLMESCKVDSEMDYFVILTEDDAISFEDLCIERGALSSIEKEALKKDLINGNIEVFWNPLTDLRNVNIRYDDVAYNSSIKFILEDFVLKNCDYHSIENNYVLLKKTIKELGYDEFFDLLDSFNGHGKFLAQFINEDESTVYVGNTFTIGFLADKNVEISVEEIEWVEFDAILEDGGFVNYMGHEDVARMVGLEMDRKSISVEKGDVLYIAQYDGPRLPEGATVLPDGAKLTPIRVKIGEKMEK